MKMTRFLLRILINAFALTSVVLGNHQKSTANDQDPPCFFNPLCVCSKAYPDLGRVTCQNIPLLNIPHQINMSKLFVLHLENNGLRHIQPHFFSRTGLLKIEITRNLLRKISEESFTGLERSLLELNLLGNRFRVIPSQSLRYLRKLRYLDLSDNEITSVRPEDWLGLEESLKTLILRGNKLSSVRPKSFAMFRQLETLDLSRNLLLELDPFVFRGGLMQLNRMNLAENLFTEIPLNLISELRELRILDMSFNRITEVRDNQGTKGKSANLSLDTLRLDYNQIEYLPALSFQYFPELNRTYLNGNPIAYLEKEAFQRTKIREVHMKACKISELKADAFAGLESHLEILNVEANNLSAVPDNFFNEFKLLKELNFKDNSIENFQFDRWFNKGGPSTVEKLDISGQTSSKVNQHNWHRLTNLRSLTMSKFPGSSLSSNDLPEHFNQLEEIKITFSNIKSLRSHAFKHVRGLRKLDLSENSILTVENEAFSEVMHSLVYLSLASGLSPALTQLPANIFENFTSVEILDLSNNGLRNLPQNLFHSMKRLKVIRLQDNFIEFMPKRAFRSNVHSDLRSIHLSYNQLSRIDSETFSGLIKLESLWLNDNRISKLDKKAFTNLNRLRYLYLRGNEISHLSDESFQDLPELEKLDLAFNKLKSFNYGCLEQVGTLSSFVLNVSFNQIEQLSSNASSASDHLSFMPEQINIKTLDLSHNNISHLEPRVFRPIESSVTHLYLFRNKLRKITKNSFEGLMHLQWLDLSHNRLSDVEQDAFANSNSIQVLYLSHNRLHELPKLLFNDFHHLRVLDLSHNELRALKENQFPATPVEILNISNNNLSKVPIFTFYGDSGKSLLELDLSGNSIVSLPSPDAFAKFKNLQWLNLSENRLMRIDDRTFSYLSDLSTLDLSHNADLTFDLRGQTFLGLEHSLEHLLLRNLSLNSMPTLYLSSLETLDVGKNSIFAIPFEFPHNLTNLRRFELADNNMYAIPPAMNAFTKLEYLGLAGNPLESINFQQSFTMREIDLRNVSLEGLERGALGKLPLLESLKVTVNQSSQDLNLPYIVKENYGLNELEVEVPEGGGFSLMNEMSGWFPPKLHRLTLLGQGLKTLPRNLLEGVQSPVFNLVLFNTSVEEITSDVFNNAKQIRNLSLNVKSNKLQSLHNPNTGKYPVAAKKLFLTQLQIADNQWLCDCSIGWIEGWERKKRQYLCADDFEECLHASDDLRSAICINRNRKSVNEVFKSELECGWNSSRTVKASFLLEFLIINVLLYTYHIYKIL